MPIRSPLTAPESAHLAAGVLDLSAGRLGAIVGALAGLTAVVIAGLALARSTGRISHGPGRTGALAALASALLAIALGALVAATADGGLGTGNGLGGAYVAVLVGAIGATLAALTLPRTRRTPTLPGTGRTR
jgi:hypothetical protein